MADLLVIEHRDGRQYAVSTADFRKYYEGDGFKGVRYESGKPYEAPKPATAPAKATARRGARTSTAPARAVVDAAASEPAGDVAGEST